MKTSLYKTAIIQWVMHVHDTWTTPLITVKAKKKKKHPSKYGQLSMENKMALLCHIMHWPCRSKMTQDKYYGLSHSEAYVNWKKKICHGKLEHCLDKTWP